MFTASYYKISGFLECPKWYFFEYLDLELKPYKKELKKPRVFLTLGENIHETLKQFMRLIPVKRTDLDLQQILEKTWSKKRGILGGFKTEEEEKAYYNDAQHMLKNFLSHQNLDLVPFYIPPDSFEEYLVCEISPDLSFGGKIDRIDKENNSLLVMDYKTSKREKDDNLQLLMYSIIAEKKFKQEVEKACYWYLRTNRIAEYETQNINKEKAVQRVTEIVARIEQEKKFLPCPGMQCYICDYVEFCPEKEKVIKMLKGDSKKEETALPF